VCEEISVHELCDYVFSKATPETPFYLLPDYKLPSYISPYPHYINWPCPVVDILAALEGDFYRIANDRELYKVNYIMLVEGDMFCSVDLQYFQRTIHTEVSAYYESKINSDVLLEICYSSRNWMFQEIKRVVDAYDSMDFQRLPKLVQSEQLLNSTCIEC
jgi:hypothetical protein